MTGWHSLRQLLQVYGFLLREHSRQWDYIVFTLLFPCLFFLIFGVPEGTDFFRANTLLGSFSAFGVIGVVLYQLAITSAQERHAAWQGYLRSLPVHPGVLLLARVLMVISFSLLSIVSVFTVAWAFTALSMDLWTFGIFTGWLLIGSLPFALIGYLLGMLVSPRGIVPLANLVYLTLSYAGGLWFPPQLLHPKIQALSAHLPSRKYAEVLWDIALYREVQTLMIRDLALQTLLIAGLIGAVYLLQTRLVKRF